MLQLGIKSDADGQRELARVRPAATVTPTTLGVSSPAVVFV
jgi:hypothetical protein